MVFEYFSTERRKERLKEQLEKEKKRAAEAEELGKLRMEVESERKKARKYSQSREFVQSVARGASVFGSGVKSTFGAVQGVAKDFGTTRTQSQRPTMGYFEASMYGDPFSTPKTKKSKKKAKKRRKRRR